MPADVTAQLDKWLQSLASSDTVNPSMTAPGVVLLIDSPQGRYLSSAGVSSLEKNTPMQPDDRLEIGSNTKSFTIAILMQLQEEGLLSMDDLLSKHLPEWAAKIPNGDKMRLRQMAQHTAGLWDYADDIIGNGATDPAALEKAYTPEELVQYAADKGKPYFAPSEGWHYSNTGYLLLGMIAEKITGQTLSELFQKRIFEPLGLKTAVRSAFPAFPPCWTTMSFSSRRSSPPTKRRATAPAGTVAAELMDRTIAHFGDPAGGFFDTASDVLGLRLKSIEDIPHPSANAVAVLQLLRLSRITGTARYRDAAERALRMFSGAAGGMGVHGGMYACGLDAWFTMLTLTVEAAPASELARAAMRLTGPYTVLVYGGDKGRVIPCREENCREPLTNVRDAMQITEQW